MIAKEKIGRNIHERRKRSWKLGYTSWETINRSVIFSSQLPFPYYQNQDLGPECDLSLYSLYIKLPRLPIRNYVRWKAITAIAEL